MKDKEHILTLDACEFVDIKILLQNKIDELEEGGKTNLSSYKMECDRFKNLLSKIKSQSNTEEKS